MASVPAPTGTRTEVYALIPSPVGHLLLTGSADALTGCRFDGDDQVDRWADGLDRDDDELGEAARQLGEYFAGSRQVFDLPLAPRGTPFQLRVWQELRAIPYGTTWSYGEMARRIGQPNASRAVGLANGRNPISIIVPCHRVIGSTGKLTGFGGGLDRKRRLLDLEAGVGPLL
jgi:methylated-DNA-[protein]-cysteine S-methyltransferase